MPIKTRYQTYFTLMMLFVLTPLNTLVLVLVFAVVPI